MAGRPRLPLAVQREFWRRVRAGVGVAAAASDAGVSLPLARRWMADGGGMPTVCLADPVGRYLSMSEREEIAVGLARGDSRRAIARRLGRPACTVSREIIRNSPRASGGRLAPDRYRAGVAQVRAEERARRPKPVKLLAYPPLRDYVQAKLVGPGHWSPQQIAHRLVVDFPDDERMRVCHETIYQALYVQSRGALRRELTAYLRTGRPARRPRGAAQSRHPRIKDAVPISERPAEADDRAVPGHWEGDLIVGADHGSAIATLVERTTRFTLLAPLPDGHSAPRVRDALAAVITKLPEHLRRSLTWDRGTELAEHVQFRVDTGVQVYFCDPHSPWQRGTNENTNGLLRQYFPKGTDLSRHPADEVAAVADALNGRPRKIHGWRTPAEMFAALLSTPT